MVAIEEELNKKYSEGGIRYTEDQLIDRAMFIRDQCMDFLINRCETLEAPKGVLIAHEMINRSLLNIEMIRSTNKVKDNSNKKITICYQQDTPPDVVIEENHFEDALDEVKK